jgi:hypothetical protein
VTFPDGSVERVNGTAISRILAINNVKKNIRFGNEKDSILTLDQTLADSIQATYHPLKPVLSTETERLSALNAAIQQAATDLTVATALLIDEGDADLGIPLAFTAKDKSLTVPPSLSERYDIYWLELAFSPSEELTQRVNELRYNITLLGEKILALDLLPERVGIEVNSTTRANTPNIQVNGLVIGEMFARTVAYKYLRPTIISRGVLTSSFGWIYTDESIDASAKKMFAIIGAPKGTKRVDAEIVVMAKCSRYLGLASEWASTARIPYEIPLPQ